MAVFSPSDRDRLRSELVAAARADRRISGAAITGSAAVQRTDRWSDIDLAFGIEVASQLPQVLADWTALMYGQHDAVHHVDIVTGATVYRVFLLRSTLQCDLAFSPAVEFAARGPTFRMLFGESAEGLAPWPQPNVQHLIGLGWLHALHARACARRGQLWRAEYMISVVRDTALALACLRHGLVHAREVDQLPEDVRAPLAGALVRQITQDEILRAFEVAMDGFLAEIGRIDADLGHRIQATLRGLVVSARS